MPTINSPLNLARPLRLGLPFRGQCQAGKLTLPNTQEIDYPQPEKVVHGQFRQIWKYGDTRYYKSPFAPGYTPGDQAEDDHYTAQGKQWKDYALFVGENKQIGAANIGANHHVYTDDAGNRWLIKAELLIPRTTPGSTSEELTQVRIVITLVGLFGMLSPAVFQTIDRVLIDTYKSTPQDDNDMCMEAYKTYQFEIPNEETPSLITEARPDGKRVLIHLYVDHFATHPFECLWSIDNDWAYIQWGSNPWGQWMFEDSWLQSEGWGRNIALQWLWEAQISGNGNRPDQTGQGNLGDGITAAVNERYAAENITAPAKDPADPYTYPHIWDSTYKAIFRITYDSAGNEAVYGFTTTDLYRSGIIMSALDGSALPGVSGPRTSVALYANNVIGYVNVYGQPATGPDPFPETEKAKFYGLFGPEGSASAFSHVKDHDIPGNDPWYRGIQATFDWDAKAVIAEASYNELCYV